MKTWSQLFLQTNLLLALGFAPAFTSAQTLAKVAVLQWSPPPARVGITAAEAEIIKQANRVTLGNFAIDAAKNGALLVIFPEFSVVGYPDIPELPPEEDEFRNREEIAPYVETASGNTFKYFSKIAAENHIAIHVGFAEVDPNDQKYYNGTLVIDSNGKRLASYRKINLYQGENNFLSRGTKPITYKSKFGVVALGTCSDIYSANLLQTYKASKTKVFAVGMSWAAHGGPMGSAAHAARTLNAHVLISNNDYFPGTGIFNPDGSTQALTVEQNGLVYGSVPV
ncbi:MAG: carbon-nitrogen hydrolase family protein, partial [Bdellovibrionales bacterium]|nr:carbon-nitrogen hydrolase family protein [Oligoflexia bacterium]